MKSAGFAFFRSSAVVVLVAAAAAGQSVGPDVIVGEIDTPDNYGSAGGISAFAIGTTSCNIGTQILQWQAGTNQHPVISQNMFRLKDGRFEHIGTSWLKHGFYALQLNVCAPCTPYPTGAALGVGCSDPYVASLNGAQGSLGPRSEVNAATGYFPFPFLLSPPIAPVTGRRLQALDSDLDPAQNPGARYFVEAQYVAADDALAGNKNNNASWREVTVFPFGGGGFGINLSGSTVRQQPAIRAWQALDPSVAIVTVDVPNDGRFLVGIKVTNVAGTTNRYEYAVQNLNSDRSLESFTVAFPGGTVTNQGFHDATYHSGEPYSGADWTPTLAGNGAMWATQPFATTPNANALRWGSIYNFRCDSNQPPTAITLGLFRPGTPASLTVGHPSPPAPSWQVNQPLATMAVDGLTNNGFVGPIIANRLTGQTGTIAISSSQTGVPWDIALTAGPGLPAPNASPSAQILNIDVADPAFAFVNGGFLNSLWGPAAVTIPYTSPATAFNRSGQFAVVTPLTAAGYAMSALNEIRVTVCQGASQPLSLGDDDSVLVPLGLPNHCGVPSVGFYGTTYTGLFVNSNGSVSFVQGSTTFTATASAFLTQMPRIAGLWTDLDPSSGGTITAASTAAGLFTVTWAGVPEYGSAVTSTFAVQFNSVTGACAILNYAPGAGHGTDSLVGISPGAGGISLPQGFSGLVGAGPQTGNAIGAIYQISFGGAPPGFTRIDFPNGNGAGFFVN